MRTEYTAGDVQSFSEETLELLAQFQKIPPTMIEIELEGERCLELFKNTEDESLKNSIRFRVIMLNGIYVKLQEASSASSSL